MMVLGGGAIGTEVSQVMARAGVKVTLVQGAEQLLPPRTRSRAGTAMRTRSRGDAGAHRAVRVECFVRRRTLHPDDARRHRAHWRAAAGRHRPPTFLRELVVEALRIGPKALFLDTKGSQRVQPGVWAVSDITGDGLFTHLGTRLADVAAADIVGEQVEPLNLDALSAVTFTDHEIGSASLTESAARESGLNVSTAFKLVGHTARGWLHSAGNEGFISSL